MQRTKGLWRLLCPWEIVSETVCHLETHVNAGDKAGNNTERDYSLSPAHCSTNRNADVGILVHMATAAVKVTDGAYQSQCEETQKVSPSAMRHFNTFQDRQAERALLQPYADCSALTCQQSPTFRPGSFQRSGREYGHTSTRVQPVLV